MTYETAVEASEIIAEIKLNDEDISLLEDAMKDDVYGVQMTIKNSSGIYTMTYKRDRLNLLLQVLYQENNNLRTRLNKL